MVNYTIYKKMHVVSEQNILRPYEFKGINALLLETFITEKDESFTKKVSDVVLKDNEKLKQIITEHNQWSCTITKLVPKLIESDTIHDSLKSVFVPIKNAEKLPMRSELSQEEFKCLTLKLPIQKNEWVLQYLPGKYHKKSQSFFVETLGDSYALEILYNSLFLEGLLKGKHIEYLI
jgi:hypothetical protein